ncbi:hypothetical protein BH09PAT1_BH09PAT1_4990 [soil metagenome]
MDNTTQPPVQSPPVEQAAIPVQVVASPPVVPISNQPLTLDPNQMSEPAVQQALVQPVAPVQAQPIQTPANAISGPHKEAGPVMMAPVAEYVRPTEMAPQLQAEVAEAGVEVVNNPEQPQLTQEHKDVGIEPAKEAVPVIIPTQPSIQLPYTSLEVKNIVKKVPISESKHWLAALTEYLLKKIQGVVVA